MTSRANPLVREARAVRDGARRELIFVEGVRLCEEALSAGLNIEAVLYSSALASKERGARLLAAASQREARRVEVSDEILSYLADTRTPQGVVLIARRPRADREAFEARASLKEARAPLVVILHRVNNPANAGAILRVAEAAGATGVVSTLGTTDLFSPKALRGSMGSTLRQPVWAGAHLGEVLEWCSSRGVRTVSTDLRASLSHTQVDWRTPTAVIAGAEAGGLERDEASATDLRIRIPMRSPVESLNVAAALAVVLYEAARQRETF